MKFPIAIAILFFAISFPSCIPPMTPDPPRHDVDSNSVEIGGVLWSKKNLSVATFNNGDTIPFAYDDSDWVQLCRAEKPASCFYENDPKNEAKYGRMYNWYAVNDPRGIAPKGWHVATKLDWQRLVDSCGGIMKAGKKLKLREGWDISDSSYNSSGFSAYAAGERHGDGSFSAAGRLTTWWTSSIYDAKYAWYVNLLDINDYVNINYMAKGGGESVRCVYNW